MRKLTQIIEGNKSGFFSAFVGFKYKRAIFSSKTSLSSPYVFQAWWDIMVITI